MMYADMLRWPPLCKKTSLTITFELRHLLTIVAPRYMFLRSRNLMVPFVLTYDLDLDLDLSRS